MAPKTTLFHLQISVFPWFFEEHQTQFSQLSSNTIFSVNQKIKKL